MKNKTILLVLLILISVMSSLKAQERNRKVEDFFDGGLITNRFIDSWVGKWISEDGKYIFNLSKSLFIAKKEPFNYSAEILVFKLTKIKGSFKLANEIIDYPINFNNIVHDDFARTSFKDPSTQTEGFMTLKKLNKNTLTVTISHLYSGKNQKGFFFPQRMVLKRQK